MRVFRPSLWIAVFAAVAAVMFVVLAYFTHRSKGWSWTAIALLCLVPVGVAGVLDALTCRIELTDEQLIVVENLRRRQYSRSAFVRATWAKGVPASLQLESGQWLQLPNVSVGNQGLANALRAWLRR
jgi:drug/metabolite transporter (DMT)-like permease